jgi:phage host-nuclease inhibitor protein Gam
MANEDTNQNFLQLQQYLIWLEEAKKRSEQSEKNAIVFSEDVSKQVAGLHNGRHVSDIVLHLSSSLQIIDAMSGRYTEEDMVSRLKFALDQTNDLQRCITDLEHELEDKSRAYEQKLENKSKAYEQELENKGNEIATLKKAHEILLEDKPRRKQTRRGKPKPQVVK